MNKNKFGLELVKKNLLSKKQDFLKGIQEDIVKEEYVQLRISKK